MNKVHQDIRRTIQYNSKISKFLDYLLYCNKKSLTFCYSQYFSFFCTTVCSLSLVKLPFDLALFSSFFHEYTGTSFVTY